MGPLKGIRVIEFAGIGPGPYCGMLLADLGAEVIRVERAQVAAIKDDNVPPADVLNRNRRHLALDLKQAEGVEAALRLLENADALIEGFRPGVMERLGLGPDVVLARNPGMVYGRMTGWGQEGPMAHAAGHDINYIALTGALEAIGRRGEKPIPPLNLVGDFGGGGLVLAFGMLAALLEKNGSGQGQVVDAAMIDGASSLMAFFYGMRASGFWTDERGGNLLDTGAHFYDVYECADGKYISLGSIEPKFYAELLRLAEIQPDDLPKQMDRSGWPAAKEHVEKVIKIKTRAEWTEIMEGTDVCFAPVLSMAEAPEHPHNKARGTFITVGDVVQPAPAPRFSRTPGEVRVLPGRTVEAVDVLLSDLGFSGDEISKLRASKAVV